MAIKRPHYFDHQFLVEADFTLEQNYHLDMRRRLNKALQSPGIAEGLEVTKATATSVFVAKGLALDGAGHEIVLEDQRTVTVPVTATAGARVFITAAYQEAQSDPSTATGAAGNTRITENPTILAVTTTPPTDGSVVLLAMFEMSAAPSVPGAVGALLDGGVRQPIRPKGGTQGIASLDNVSNAGGNIDLVPQQSIVITPDQANNRIVIAENHSGRTDNPHQTTAAQLGAMALADYDLRRRTIVPVSFTDGQANGAPLTIPIPFLPKVIIITGVCSAKLTTNTYSGGVSGFGFFDSGSLSFISVGFGLTKLSATDLITQGRLSKTLVASSFADHTATPAKQGENLSITLSSVSANAMVVVFNRSVLPNFVPLPEFQINLHLLLLG